MSFKQFYLGCLAHASYLIGSQGDAAVIDPQRDIEQYLSEASQAGLKIKYIIETHLHADFVSGHRELAEKTGAQIVFGEKARANFPHLAVRDGDELPVGNITLKILETPGHTPESISILAIDATGSETPKRLFTGDTLFIGDVGRPDLVGAKGYTAEVMAGMLYDSLHNKILTLDDQVEVYPAHGAGSMCGRNISSDTFSTLGNQRRFNYALQPMSRESFIKLMTTDLPEAPAYFPVDAELNRQGAGSLKDLPELPALSPKEIIALFQHGATILDVRNAAAYGAGHIKDSINIALGGQFASWSGCLLNLNEPIIIVSESQEGVNEAQMRLARVGIENVKGYLDGGIKSWSDAGLPLATIAQISVEELQQRLNENKHLQLIDVRRTGEFKNGHAPGAINIPLASIAKANLSVDSLEPTLVICAGGYRSSAATSILERRGFQNLCNIVGGTSAWINAGLPIEN
ncbi:MAG: rhodanese-like domain-containing protein [Acidobacteriota bacterium]